MYEALEECQAELMELEERPGDMEALGNLVGFMSQASAMATRVLSSPTDCALWGSRASQFMDQPVNLRRSIDRITSFFRHVAELVVVTYSPKFACIFERDFVVTPVPAAGSPPLIPVWPADPDAPQWTQIRDSLFKLADYESISISSATDTAAADSDTAGTTRATRMALPRSQIPVSTAFQVSSGDGSGAHCEVALILHLDARPQTMTFNYIGVSKRPCKACFLWVEAHNVCTRWKPFYTGGAQDRWCAGWTMPQCPRVIQRRFVRLLAGEYAGEKERRGEARARDLP